MAETDINTINIPSLLKANIKSFKEKIANINTETLKVLQTILLDAKSSRANTLAFYKEHGNTTGIDQRLIRISAIILKTTNNVKSDVNGALQRQS